MTLARAVWFERPGIAAIRSEALPPVGPGQVAIQTVCSGVSAGTERIVLLGGVPSEVAPSMAVPHMRGSFVLPISYGYSAVGVVEIAATDVAAPRVGDLVFALHPHHDRFVIAAGEARALPGAVPTARLVLAANLETAINVVWDAELALGDQVAVVGLGVVGLLVVWLAVRSGASVVGIDPDPERRSIATALGAGRAEASAPAALAGADAIVECSGNPDALGAAIAEAGPAARVVVASWFGARSVALPLGGRFHPNRVTLQSSQVATIPAHRRRWNTARRWELVCELLADPALDRLIAPAVPLSEAPAVYAELAGGVRWNPPQRVFDATS